MEKKSSNKGLGVTFNGNVTFQGPMFDIHDNEHVQIIHQGMTGEKKKDGEELPEQEAKSGGSGLRTEEEREVGIIEEKKLRLSESRQEIADRIMMWVQKGDWLDDKVADGVRTMMSEMLTRSEVLWQLLEQGRGDRVRIVWQNIVGYLDDKKLLRKKGTPALNADFFGDTEGYTNIDKGRPSSKNISSSFNRLLPILEEFTSKI